MKLLILFLLAAAFATAQSFSFGVKGGVPATDALSSGTSHVSDYVIGPMAELRLPFGLGVEADALYRPVVSGASAWEFPIVGKFRFVPAPLIHPYVEAGANFRALTGSAIQNPSNKGFALGAGVEIKPPIIRVSPELRYTHWGSGGTGPLQLGSNQLEFLVGLSF